jgi:hypothetical protein
VSEKPSEQVGAQGDDGDEDKDEKYVKADPEPPGEKTPCSKGEDDDKQILSQRR